MLFRKYYEVDLSLSKKIRGLSGPIVIFGSGGFIGTNLLNSILPYRKDVYGVSHDHLNNWRFTASGVPLSNLINCDITDPNQVDDLVKNIRPRTVFNLAAYGAYSKQKEYNKIYAVNFNAAITLMEMLKKNNFHAYVHAGSSSEYGLNSVAPKESAELIPNTHYSVSKVAAYYLMKYYGKVEQLPVVHLRIYSAYGPWEEPDRLIPTLVSHSRSNSFPPLVNPNISRDFIYITDVCSAFITAAYKLRKKHYGEVFNIGTGKKTTVRDLVGLVKKQFHVKARAKFSSMPDRDWDLPDWYSDSGYIKEELKWKPGVSLVDGIGKTVLWQEEINFDNAAWNWTKRK